MFIQWLWKISLVLTVVMSLAACERQNHTVRYEIGGTADNIAITYRNATNATETANVNPPWTLEFQVQTFTQVSLVAQNLTQDGSVSCRIIVDGRVVSEGESPGAFKRVRCNSLVTLPTPTPQPQ